MNKKFVYQVGNNKNLYYDAPPTKYQDLLCLLLHVYVPIYGQQKFLRPSFLQEIQMKSKIFERSANQTVTGKKSVSRPYNIKWRTRSLKALG